MTPSPIEPARVVFGEAGHPPVAPTYDDLYHPRIGAAAQTRHVFLQGNGLPGRWAGRARFVVLETGFGLGNNFLATWQAWRDDPARCERLHFVSVERHPLTREDLGRAHAASPWPDLAEALLKAWPPLTANLHALDFDHGRVQLLLALGDAGTLLPQLRLGADAIYLDGFAPARNPAMWQLPLLKALGRLAAPGATSATWSVARELRDGLATAGFEVQRQPGIGGKREITVARHHTRPGVRTLPGCAVDARSAVVVGAGAAGAAAAQALARQGLQVTVLERCAQPATQGSGNLAGIFHGTLNADDGRHARLFRAAALCAQREVAAAIGHGQVEGSAAGLLRLHTDDDGLPGMQRLLLRLGLPTDYVRALDAAQASAAAGVALPGPAWLYAGGGWVTPPAWVRGALATPGVTLRCDNHIAALKRAGDDWCLLDADGHEQARAAIVVLANAEDAARLLAPLGHAGWPLRRTRGQVTHWTGEHAPLRLPVAGDGYALPRPGGGVLCGATNEPDGGDEPAVREADHAFNLQRLHRLTGLHGPADPATWQGRVGWRVQSDDRLPIVGPLPVLVLPPGQRMDQPRLLPREPGLFVLTALGSRGLTLAPLMARLVAAQATGAPWPLEQDLVDAVDPARWQVRSARAAAARRESQVG